MASIDGKVKQLADNALTLKDIRTRPALWYKPTDISIIKNKDGSEKQISTYKDLRIYYEWPYWTRGYNFLPLYNEFKEIRKQVLQNLKKKKEDKDGMPLEEGKKKGLTPDQNTDKYPQLNYFLVKKTNNVITVIFQNYKSYDLSKPNTCFFWGNEKPMLYWITSEELINVGKGYVQVRAEMDLIWRDYDRYCGSWGTANIKKSMIGYFHNEHEDDEPGDDGEYTLPSEKGILKCFACSNWCFDFCSDLRNNVSSAGNLNLGSKAIRAELWKPKFGLGFVHPNRNKKAGSLRATGDKVRIEDPETRETIVEVPNIIQLHPWKGGERPLADMFWGDDKPFLLFLLDKTHAEDLDKNKTIGIISQNNVWIDSKKLHFSTLPEEFNKQPHLLRHSSALFCFKDSISQPSNLKHVNVRKIGGKLKLVYQVYRKSSISGINYIFKSGDIIFRWNLKAVGQIQNTQNLLGNLIDGLFDFFGKKGTKLREDTNLDQEESGFSWGLGKLFSAIKAGIKGWLMKQVGTNINDMLTGEKFEKMIGTNPTKTVLHVNEEKPDQSKQSQLKATSTNLSRSKVSEPSMLHADTKNFNHDFWGFANSLTSPVFEIRYQFSNVFYDNLINNNNATPNQNIQCKFKHFTQIMKPGEFQGKVSLHYEDGGFFAGILSRGTYFVESFTDEKKMFQNWQYKGTSLTSFSFPKENPVGNDRSLLNIIPGEDEPGKKEKKDESDGHDNVIPDTTSVYISKQSFCRGPDGNIIDQLMSSLSADYKQQPDSSYWYFWHNMSMEGAEIRVQEGEWEWKTFGFGGRDGKHAKEHCNIFKAVHNGIHVIIEGYLETPGRQKDPSIEILDEKKDDQKEKEIIIDNYDNPSSPDLGTEIEPDLELDLDDDRDDQDLDDGDIDPDSDEKEREEDMDPDIDQDLDKDKDRDDDVDSDIDVDYDPDEDTDLDFDFDRDKDKDADDDTDIDPDADHEDKDDDQDRDRG